MKDVNIRYIASGSGIKKGEIQATVLDAYNRIFAEIGREDLFFTESEFNDSKDVSDREFSLKCPLTKQFVDFRVALFESGMQSRQQTISVTADAKDVEHYASLRLYGGSELGKYISVSAMMGSIASYQLECDRIPSERAVKDALEGELNSFDLTDGVSVSRKLSLKGSKVSAHWYLSVSQKYKGQELRGCVTVDSVAKSAKAVAKRFDVAELSDRVKSRIAAIDKENAFKDGKAALTERFKDRCDGTPFNFPEFGQASVRFPYLSLNAEQLDKVLTALGH